MHTHAYCLYWVILYYIIQISLNMDAKALIRDEKTKIAHKMNLLHAVLKWLAVWLSGVQHII